MQIPPHTPPRYSVTWEAVPMGSILLMSPVWDCSLLKRRLGTNGLRTPGDFRMSIVQAMEAFSGRPMIHGSFFFFFSFDLVPLYLTSLIFPPDALSRVSAFESRRTGVGRS